MSTYQVAFTINGALSGQFSAAMRAAQNQMTALANTAAVSAARASSSFRAMEQYAQNLNAIKGNIDNYKTLNANLSETTQATAQARQKSTQLLTNYQAEQKKLEDMRRAYEQFKKARKDNKSTMSTEQYKLMGEQLKQMRQELQAQRQVVQSAGQAYNAASQQAQRLTTQLRQQQAALASLQSQLSSANVNVSQLAQHEANLQREIARTTQALERQAQVAQARQNQSQASQNLSNAYGNFQGAISTAQSIMSPFVGAVETAATFEKSMSKVKALSGATGAEFETLRNQAKELGATTQFTATQSADAMGYLAMSGWAILTLCIIKWCRLNVKCFEILKAQKLQRGLKRRA